MTHHVVLRVRKEAIDVPLGIPPVFANVLGESHLFLLSGVTEREHREPFGKLPDDRKLRLRNAHHLEKDERRHLKHEITR